MGEQDVDSTILLNVFIFLPQIFLPLSLIVAAWPRQEFRGFMVSLYMPIHQAARADDRASEK